MRDIKSVKDGEPYYRGVITLLDMYEDNSHLVLLHSEDRGYAYIYHEEKPLYHWEVDAEHRFVAAEFSALPIRWFKRSGEVVQDIRLFSDPGSVGRRLWAEFQSKAIELLT
jgi:hypothetical protein